MTVEARRPNSQNSICIIKTKVMAVNEKFNDIVIFSQKQQK